MAINCEIKFDQNPYGIYFAGQTLLGRAELRLAKPKKVKGVCVKIVGYSHCHWTERGISRGNNGHGSKQSTVNYIGREDYVWTTTYFLGSEEGNQQLELPAGHHSYSFSCDLPAHLPTSYEGTYGHIRYTVRLVLERPWKFDQSYNVAFTVLKQFDLNYDSPILRIPTQMELTENFCCGPCSTGPFSIVASIPQSGFVSGQVIKVSTQVSNLSTIPVDLMHFSLRKIVSYHCQTPSTNTKREIVDIQERRVGGVSKNDHGRFLVSLPVPPVPPTIDANFCKVIHISYDIKIEARLSGLLHKNPFICIPITIGTIPLQVNYPDTIISQQPINAQLNTTTTASTGDDEPPAVVVVVPSNLNRIENNISPTTTTRTPIMNPISNVGGPATSRREMPPPSYEETFGTSHHRRIIDDDEQSPISHQQLYAPRYPVYDFSEITTTTTTSTSTSTINENDDEESNSHGNGARATPHPEKILEKMEMI